MKTKIIPFDLETALDIQKGRTKGRIITKLSESVRIVFWGDKEDSLIVALVNDGNKEEARCYTLNGNLLREGGLSAYNLVLEVPDDEPKFKPFDRVLVRDCDIDNKVWRCSIFSHYDVLNERFSCVNGSWKQCIPYEGNEDLVGTTNKPKED